MKSDRTEFSRAVREAAWQRCQGHCEAINCRVKIMSGAQYDHRVPSSLGGASDLDNVQVLCARCHRLKTSTEDVPRIAKAKRIESRRANINPKKPWPKRTVRQA